MRVNFTLKLKGRDCHIGKRGIQEVYFRYEYTNGLHRHKQVKNYIKQTLIK